MSDHIVYIAPPKTESEIVAPAAPPPAPLSHEQIQAVDAAFASSPEPDLSALVLTLWMNMPFVLEMARDHFPGREQPAESDERELPQE